MPGQDRVALLKPLVTSPLIEVGAFSYYDDPDGPTAFETRNVLYHYGPEKLVIGLPGRGDTVVGHDVWLGYQTLVMPGIRIGHGAIVASGSVVVGDVPDYGVVGGNPARLIRRRHSDADIDRLLALAWRDWPLEQITEHLRTIMSGTVDDLEAVADSR